MNLKKDPYGRLACSEERSRPNSIKDPSLPVVSTVQHWYNDTTYNDAQQDLHMMLAHQHLLAV
jgi:hypothetical protein